MSDEMCTSPNYYLADRFFRERIDSESQFFNFLVKSAKNRNDRVRSVAEFKNEIAELEKLQTPETEDAKRKEQLEQIAKLKSKVADLESKIVFFDEIVQDYAADFETRRESKDKSDDEQLSRNKRMYLNDIYITSKGIHRQKKEMTQLNESIAAYYHHYPSRPTNTDVDDLLVKKKTLSKEITQKTNFIQDCETNLEHLNVKLNFISPSETQKPKVEQERLIAYYKVIQAKSTLTKMVSKLEHVIGELKPKLAEVEDQLKEFDKQYSFANNSFEEGVDACDAELFTMFDKLSAQNDNIKKVVNDHAIIFYNCNAYSRKWTHSNLKRSILEAQKTMEEYRDISQMKHRKRPKRSISQDDKERSSRSKIREPLDESQRNRPEKIRSQIQNIRLGDQMMNDIHKVSSEVVRINVKSTEREEGEADMSSSLSLSSD